MDFCSFDNGLKQLYKNFCSQDGVQVKKSSSSKSSKKSKTYKNKAMLYDQFVKVGLVDIFIGDRAEPKCPCLSLSLRGQINREY